MLPPPPPPCNCNLCTLWSFETDLNILNVTFLEAKFLLKLFLARNKCFIEIDFADISSAELIEDVRSEIQSHPTIPSTYSYWAFKPVSIEAFKRSKTFYGDLWQFVALLDY